MRHQLDEINNQDEYPITNFNSEFLTTLPFIFADVSLNYEISKWGLIECQCKRTNVCECGDKLRTGSFNRSLRNKIVKESSFNRLWPVL